MADPAELAALAVRAGELRSQLAATRSTEIVDRWPDLTPADKLILALSVDEELPIDAIARFYQIPRESAQRRLDEAMARRDAAQRLS